MTNILQRQWQELEFLLQEATPWVREYENELDKDLYEKCCKAGTKEFEAWIEKFHDIEKVKVEATIQP